MTEERRVDIIVSNRNYSRFLPSAIESALSQTHPNVRVIVVDDGSTDRSAEIMSSYGDRIAPIVKEQGGQASAWNAGFARSEGDVILFLDSDDVLLADTANLVTRAVEEHRGAARVQYRMEVIDANGRRTGRLSPAPHIPLPSGDLRRQELRFPFDIAMSATSGNAFPRWVVERLLPIPEAQFAASPDWYLTHLSSLLGPVISFDSVGALYRVHGQNSYALVDARLDLKHIRQSIGYAAATREQLRRVAGELHLHTPARILSVSDISNRLVSRRLDPPSHPIRTDTIAGLVASGWQAAARRSDVSPLIRGLFALWFVAMAIAPRALAPRVAERFLFPERRPNLNRLLSPLHRRSARQ